MPVQPTSENTTQPFDDLYNEWNYYYDGGDPPDFDQFFVQAVPKKDVVQRVQEIKDTDSSRKMNVLMIAFDSMSHLCYQRKLARTYRYVQERLGAVVLQGYNIVGDATTAAIVPMLTGKLMQELPEVRRNQPGSTYVDVYPFIWNKFEQQGYVTMYAEDQPSLGTFNLRMNGFEQIPTDHYMRHFWQAVWDSELKRDSPRHCVGELPYPRYMLDYAKDFFRKYPDTPKFAFVFSGELSHSDNNPVEYADEHVVNMLESLRKEGHLENTLVIVMGDHGARYSSVRQTVQGKLEERLPMMSFAFPKWFKQKHPELINNLKSNSLGLSTPFDIHETLKDVLHLPKQRAMAKTSKRATSLLRPIPINRTCSSAGVDMHWCTCLHWQTIPKNDYNAQKALPLIINYINKKTVQIRNLCHELTLKSVQDVKVITPNEKLLQFTKSIDGDQRIANFSSEIKMDIIHFQIILETSPNNGIYETTLHLDTSSGKFTVHPDISRINRYGDQPHCVLDTHAHLRKFCYCRANPTAASPKTRGTKKKLKLKKKGQTEQLIHKKKDTL